MNDKFKKLISNDDNVETVAEEPEVIEVEEPGVDYNEATLDEMRKEGDDIANPQSLQVKSVQDGEVSGVPQLHNVNAETKFTSAVDKLKVGVLEDATAGEGYDEKFVEDVKRKLKDATLQLAEVEKDKADLEAQNIQYHSELLETQQELNEHLQAENKWKNREKRRAYHYAGVKPILTFVGINDPMNLIFLYLLVIVILPFFLLSKFFKGTVGAIIAGADDENRPAKVRGFLWTMIGLIFTAAAALLIYLALMWLNIIPTP